MKRVARPILVIACLLAAWAGRSDPLLRPGLLLGYRVEILGAGKQSEEQLELRVQDAAGSDLWRLELELGRDAVRYRALYSSAGDRSPFDATRFESVETWEDGWHRVDPTQMEILSTLQEMEGLLAGKSWDAESTFVVGGRELPCRRYAFADSTQDVQIGESVVLRTVTHRRGEAWLTEDLPFGGWVRYHEERRSRKFSEFGGRRFEGDEESSRETWTLSELTGDD